jgi:hypothetical protein
MTELWNAALAAWPHSQSLSEAELNRSRRWLEFAPEPRKAAAYQRPASMPRTAEKVWIRTRTRSTCDRTEPSQGFTPMGSRWVGTGDP